MGSGSCCEAEMGILTMVAALLIDIAALLVARTEWPADEPAGGDCIRDSRTEDPPFDTLAEAS